MIPTPETHTSSLAREIASALNRHCAENESNTPDYILAEFLLGCLRAWDETTRKRERWYGRNPNDGPGQATPRAYLNSCDCAYCDIGGQECACACHLPATPDPQESR